MNGEGRGVTRGEKVVLALCDMADGEYEEAVAKWRELEEEEEGDEMVMVNLAVCLLYVGRMQEVSCVFLLFVEMRELLMFLTVGTSIVGGNGGCWSVVAYFVV